MKSISRILKCGLVFTTIGIVTSCSDIDIPNHELDVEFRYELTCSDALLKYVTPQVSFMDEFGTQRTFTIEDGMWNGNEHKTWKQSVHYDSLNVSNTMTVVYLPKGDATYKNELDFDYVHSLSCLIIVQEDGKGRRNNYTIIPDFPAKTNITSDALKVYVERLSSKITTRGGKVDLKGEITKIEND